MQFGALQVTPRVCYSRPPTETPNTNSFVEVDEVTLQGEIKRIFTGWMFAASPGLHAVEHPIYDVWLTDCKGGKNPNVAEAPPDQPPPPKPATRPAAGKARAAAAPAAARLAASIKIASSERRAASSEQRVVFPIRYSPLAIRDSKSPTPPRR